jgi:hypothetical protein
MDILTSNQLATRLIYADACQANMALKAMEADAKSEFDEYFRLMKLVRGLHWRIASLRCLTLTDGVLDEGCLTDEQFRRVLNWIDEVCGTECCSCASVMEDNVPAILQM